MVLIAMRSSNPMLLACPGTNAPWNGKRSPPKIVVYPEFGESVTV